MKICDNCGKMFRDARAECCKYCGSKLRNEKIEFFLNGFLMKKETDKTVIHTKKLKYYDDIIYSELGMSVDEIMKEIVEKLDDKPLISCDKKCEEYSFNICFYDYCITEIPFSEINNLILNYSQYFSFSLRETLKKLMSILGSISPEAILALKLL